MSHTPTPFAAAALYFPQMVTTPPIPMAPLRSRVEGLLNKIRPAVQADGGDVELVDVVESTGQVNIRFHGACHGCPSAPMTLQHGIERNLRDQIPEVRSVVAVP